MVKLYVADISNLPDPMLNPELLYKLPLERQQRILNMKQEKSRKQSMGVGLLLQKVLALYHMQDSQVYVGEHGKPMIDGLEFSLSHSGNLVICAVSNQPIGCDIEKLREAPKGVAERYFSASEQVFVDSNAGEEHKRAFFQIWTMKESYVKMTGEGLGVPFKAYELVFEEKSCAHSWHKSYAKIVRDGEEQSCHLNSVELQGYIVSVCAEDIGPAEIIWENL